MLRVSGAGAAGPMSARSRTARTTKTRAAGDGVRITRDPGPRKEIRLGVAALALAGLAVLAAVMLFGGEPGPRATHASAPSEERVEGEPAAPAGGAQVRVAAHPRKSMAAPAPVAAPPPSRPTQEPESAPAAQARAADGGPPTHEEPAFSLGPPGTGISAFPKPGSDPVKIGIVVPEDFELPEGFVRHHQVTDDGVGLPAILMFHPDYEFVDEDGRPLAIPADRVVPQELAPPGLEVKLLEVPEAPAEPAP
jgi:hypothetical protein